MTIHQAISTDAIDIPRPEHPNPQMRRDHWYNLNGQWDFDF